MTVNEAVNDYIRRSIFEECKVVTRWKFEAEVEENEKEREKLRAKIARATSVVITNYAADILRTHYSFREEFNG